MKQQNINVYVRVRPPPKNKQQCLYSIENNKRMLFDVPKEHASYLINNTKEHFEFNFENCFDQPTTQDSIFDTVAKPTLDSALSGFNGTIFAYGQTGSGKTFTMTGGAGRFSDRGIIPRTLQYLFQTVKKRTDYTHQVHVSYLEIYNDNAYDLLSETDENKPSRDVQLNRVYLREDSDGNLHLKNLSAHVANSEEEALGYLFMGDTNRTVSETSMNLESSRSHCIFTVYITASQLGSDVVRRSKVHLVDLAGSERVHKTNASGRTLTEAKFINGSLHFLEMVIIALQERSRGKKTFVPYRNSLMTSVLRDSLGGNCKTSMIATVTPELAHLDESMSTCRFAQRVAMVSNAVEANEEVDPTKVIARLKREVAELNEEVAMLRGEAGESSQLSEDDSDKIRHMVSEFVDDPGAQSLAVGADMTKIRLAFTFLRECVWKAREEAKQGPQSSYTDDQVSKLQLQLQERNNEIAILVNMLNKPGSSVVDGREALQQAAEAASRNYPPLHQQPQQQQQMMSSTGPAALITGASSSQAAPSGMPASAPSEELFDADLLKDRAKSFEHFRRSYRKNETIEENKAVLKSKYEEANRLGEAGKASKRKISELKALIEKRRVEKAMQGLSNDSSAVSPDAEQERLQASIDKERVTYKSHFDRLRELKSEIDYLHKSLEKARENLTRDFESWFKIMSRQAGPSNTGPSGRSSSMSTSSHTKEALQTKSMDMGGSSVDVLSQATTMSQMSTSMPSSRGSLNNGSRPPSITGNPDADADIMKFYQDRDSLIKR